jgi:hypothetical protein
MPTLSKEQVDNIIKHNGWYNGDRSDPPRIVKVVQYNNKFNGALAYGCVYEGGDLMGYETSPACHNPKVIWEAR